MFSRCSRHAATLLLALFSFTSLGCEAFGYVAGAFSSNKVPAVYEIQDLPTLILVDDPSLQLLEPGLAGTIAINVAMELKEKEVVKDVIDISKVAELSRALGDKFAATPVDQIGRSLGATQVIHIHIDSIPPFQAEPGTLRPIANILVKVIDVSQRPPIRLFPPAEAKPGAPAIPITRGMYPMTITMKLRTDGNIDNAMSAYRQRFAERIGLRVARLFFKHDPADTDDVRAD